MLGRSTFLLLVPLLAAVGCHSYRAPQAPAEVLGTQPTGVVRLIHRDGGASTVHAVRLEELVILGLPCGECGANPATFPLEDIEAVRVRRLDVPRTMAYTTIAAGTTLALVALAVRGMAIP